METKITDQNNQNDQIDSQKYLHSDFPQEEKHIIKNNVDKSKIQVEFDDFIAEMTKMSKENVNFNKEYQLERLISKFYINPYDVLEIGYEASEVEIKKKYKMLSMLVHPDKNKHEKAAQAFNTVEKAYKELMDADKRRTYQRVMREAKERVELQRKKINEKKMLQGQDPLPNDTFDLEVQNMCQVLFQEIEQKKKRFERLDQAYKNAQKMEIQLEQTKDLILKEDAMEWEKNREKRVQNWRDFNYTKSKKIQKQKKYDEKGIKKTIFKNYEMKAAPVKPEERPQFLKNSEQFGIIQGDHKFQKPMGIQEEYKKTWR